jgi:Cys-tRNA(Pro)/Cys-tRNA(Cys) deacylase
VAGYIRGACSPIGMKKHYPTYIHHSCEEHPYIFVSAGQRGLQLKISPSDLISVTKAQISDLI